MRLFIIIASFWVLVLSKPEMYREKEDFQYSRSSSDEGSKAGYYGAQRGNMGGNYEKAHNMDTFAQHQMSNVVGQVDGELGEGANTRTGSVYTAGNSRGIYGSGNYDLSNLKGRNFAEGSSYDDLLSHSLLSQTSGKSGYEGSYSAANTARYSNSRSQSSALSSGYRTSGLASQYAQIEDQQEADRYHGARNYEYGTQSGRSYKYSSQSGSQARNEYDQNNANLNSYDYNTGGRLIYKPVRIYGRPGTRVAVPISAHMYDASQSSSSHDQNAIRSDAELLLGTSGQRIDYIPLNKGKHYESAYSYRKEWEKHDTQPVILTSTENPFPKNSELFEDTQSALTASNLYQIKTDSANSHSSNTNSAYSSGYSDNVQSASSSDSKYQSQQQQSSGVSALANTYSRGATASLYGSQVSDATANSNNMVENIRSKPKSYHNSYSYHKSWERRGDPYVIKPVVDVNDQASQRLTAENSNSYLCSYCLEDSQQRVRRSYDLDQYEDSQNSQEELLQHFINGWNNDLGQQEDSKWEQLQDFGQQTQNKWDNFENLGQQPQNEWGNLENLGQQIQNQWGNLEELGQQIQNQLGNLEELGQQTQNQWGAPDDLGQQTQNQWGNLEDLGQQTQKLDGKLEDLGQQSQNQWGNIEDLGQQTQNQWGNLEHLGQQTQNQWDKQEELDQHAQNKLDNSEKSVQKEQNKKLEFSSQPTENQEGKTREIGQQIQNELDKSENFGQKTQNQWDKLEDLGQQTQTQWSKFEDLGQQHWSKIKKPEELGQQPQTQWHQVNNLNQPERKIEQQQELGIVTDLGHQVQNNGNFGQFYQMSQHNLVDNIPNYINQNNWHQETHNGNMFNQNQDAYNPWYSFGSFVPYSSTTPEIPEERNSIDNKQQLLWDKINNAYKEDETINGFGYQNVNTQIHQSSDKNLKESPYDNLFNPKLNQVKEPNDGEVAISRNVQNDKNDLHTDDKVHETSQNVSDTDSLQDKKSLNASDHLVDTGRGDIGPEETSIESSYKLNEKTPEELEYLSLMKDLNNQIGNKTKDEPIELSIIGLNQKNEFISKENSSNLTTILETVTSTNKPNNDIKSMPSNDEFLPNSKKVLTSPLSNNNIYPSSIVNEKNESLEQTNLAQQQYNFPYQQEKNSEQQDIQHHVDYLKEETTRQNKETENQLEEQNFEQQNTDLQLEMFQQQNLGQKLETFEQQNMGHLQETFDKQKLGLQLETFEQQSLGEKLESSDQMNWWQQSESLGNKNINQLETFEQHDIVPVESFEPQDKGHDNTFNKEYLDHKSNSFEQNMNTDESLIDIGQQIQKPMNNNKPKTSESQLKQYERTISNQYAKEQDEEQSSKSVEQTSSKNQNDLLIPVEPTTEKPGFWSSVWSKTKSAKDSVVSWFHN